MSDQEQSVADFVQQTLQQIVQGISRAQGNEGQAPNITIPRYIEDDRFGKALDVYSGRRVSTVEFDLAIQASSATNVSGKIEAGLKVYMARAGGDVTSEKANATALTQRVCFTIPVVWPSHDGAPSEDEYRKIRFQQGQQLQETQRAMQEDFQRRGRRPSR